MADEPGLEFHRHRRAEQTFATDAARLHRGDRHPRRPHRLEPADLKPIRGIAEQRGPASDMKPRFGRGELIARVGVDRDGAKRHDLRGPALALRRPGEGGETCAGWCLERLGRRDGVCCGTGQRISSPHANGNSQNAGQPGDEAACGSAAHSQIVRRAAADTIGHHGVIIDFDRAAMGDFDPERDGGIEIETCLGFILCGRSPHRVIESGPA